MSDRANPYEEKTHPWSSHRQIVAALAGLPKGARVLDVGAASGTLGKLCEGMSLAVRGIEPEARWIESGRRYYQDVLVSTIDDAPEDFLRDHSAVVCGDVLEHLPDPDRTLSRLVALQRPGSRFIVSVPNVANIWVRLNLLFGRFDYTDRGILDRTHLRFFTRRSFIGFLSRSGLAVQRVSVTPIPLDLVSPFFARSVFGRNLFRLLAGATRVWPTLLGFQLVAVCEVRQRPQ